MSKITKRLVDATSPGDKDRFIWDDEVKGFGLKVTSAGRRVYVVQYRMGGRGTPTRRLTIGRHGQPWTVDQARTEARRLLGHVAAGRDPQAEKRAAREGQAEAVKNTVAELTPVFVARHYRANGLRTADEVERTLNREMVNRWGSRPVASLTKKEIGRAIDDVADRAPIWANRVFGFMSQFFDWCVGRHVIDASPMAGLKKPSRERSRDRVLSDDEIRDVWLASDDIGWPFGPVVKLLLLTGQRRDEVAGLRRSELNIADKLWSLPADRTKNARAHDVPLSDMAIGIVEGLPDLSGEQEDGDLLFSTTGRTPISGFSKIKLAIDRKIAERRAREHGDDAEPMPSWRFHDLRRTVTTGLARLGVAPHVADRVLNHVTGTIGGVYNRFQYLDERRIALDAWGRHVEQIVAGEEAGTNVVPMVRGQ